MDAAAALGMLGQEVVFESEDPERKRGSGKEGERTSSGLRSELECADVEPTPTLSQQRGLLAEKLLCEIRVLQPELAGKITGMILEREKDNGALIKL